MGGETKRSIHETVNLVYKSEGPRILSTLIRLLRDFDLAEDAMHEAFTVAVQQWPKDGVPANPRAWLVSTGRFKAIDALRRDSRLSAALRTVEESPDNEFFPDFDESSIEDDRLRLIFACCHPVLSDEGQIALTLRNVCGLTTEEIASAFLTPVCTIAQRIVRAKSKIREDDIAYEIPPLDELAERTHTVLQVIYLLFNEGYYASSGESLTQQALSGEAIRLGRLVAELLPDSEVFGLLALMLLNESRRAARTSPSGDIVLLPDQDRSLWDHSQMDEGLSLCAWLPESGSGPYALQAAITATHIEGALIGQTDWNRIVALYDSMLARNSSPIVELNRAAAISMRDGPLAALPLIDDLLSGGELEGYALAYATQADMYRRLDRMEEAGQAYTRALELTTQAAERRFLEGRLQEVTPK